jgi:hypothetical protein
MSRSSDPDGRGAPGASTVFRYAVYYRAVATVSFLVGMGIALAGVWLGLGEAVAVALDSFLQEGVMGRAMDAANLPLTLALVAVGVLVWQVGKTAAFYWTFSAALAEGDASPTGGEPAPPAGSGSPDTPTGATQGRGETAPSRQGESTTPAEPTAGSETAGDGSADPLAGGTEATGGGRPDDGGTPE